MVRILTVLIDNVDEFYLEHLRRNPADIKEDSVFSDETEIKGDKWEVLKHVAMQEDFKQTSQFVSHLMKFNRLISIRKSMTRMSEFLSKDLFCSRRYKETWNLSNRTSSCATRPNCTA